MIVTTPTQVCKNTSFYEQHNPKHKQQETEEEQTDKNSQIHPLTPFFLISHNPCIYPFWAHLLN